MKIFGFGKKKKIKLPVTNPDKEWVEDNFRWLIQVLGYPNSHDNEIHLNQVFFPKSIDASGSVNVRNIIEDLSALLIVNPHRISFELIKDLSDSEETPYEIVGAPFETELHEENGAYKIYIANTLIKYPNRLMLNLICEFIQIRLKECNLEYDTGEDTNLFIYIAGVYLGFGVILSQNLMESGRANDGLWERKWQYVSEIPIEIMAFSLAFHSKLKNVDEPAWKSLLSEDIKLNFENTIAYLNQYPSCVFNKQELDANDLYIEAQSSYINKDFKDSIITYQKVVELTEDQCLKIEAFNNIGSCLLRIEDFEKSMMYFLKALELIPDYTLANDNMSYALIRTGRLDEANVYIKKVLESENYNLAYCYRSIGLYHYLKEEFKESEKYYDLAFQHKVNDIDLLEYHYSELLIATNRLDKGVEFLRKAGEKGEIEAIKKLETIA